MNAFRRLDTPATLLAAFGIALSGSSLLIAALCLVPGAGNAANWALWTALGVNCVLHAGVLHWVQRALARPLRQAVEAMGRVADGDLSRPAAPAPHSLALLRALADMQDKLAAAIAGLRTAGETLGSSAGASAISALYLARRSGQQADQLDILAERIGRLAGQAGAEHSIHFEQAQGILAALQKTARQTAALANERAADAAALRDEAVHAGRLAGRFLLGEQYPAARPAVTLVADNAWRRQVPGVPVRKPGPVAVVRASMAEHQVVWD